MKISSKKAQSGFSLVETLVYIVVLVLVVGATSFFIVKAYGIYRDAVLGAQADRVGISILNQLVRETRSGASLDLGNSALGSPTGSVTVNEADGTTKYFAYDNGQIVYSDNGVSPEALTPASLSVSTFQIDEIITPVSYALHFDVGITFMVSGEAVTRHYRGVSTLRRSYE